MSATRVWACRPLESHFAMLGKLVVLAMNKNKFSTLIVELEEVSDYVERRDNG